MTTLANYVEACGDYCVAVSGDTATVIGGLCHDSRAAKPGDLFVAIQGAVVDGRRFIADAVRRGAVAVLYGGEPIADLVVPSIQVSDDYAAFGRAAELCFGFPARSLVIAGITGTNGKTTTAYLLRDILRQAGHEVGLIGTVQYEYAGQVIEADRTTPMPSDLQGLLRDMVEAGVTHVVMEASSHALAQRRLGSMQLHVAAFTNLTLDHGDYHPTLEDYFQAKARLFNEYLLPGGTAVINADDSWGRRLAGELPSACTYGIVEPADWQVEACELSREGGDVRLCCPAGTCTITTPLTGNYNVSNMLAAAASAHALGVDMSTIQQAVAAFPGVPGRLQRLDGDKGISIFVDYAHTADALSNVLRAVAPFKNHRLVVIFGCGGDRDRTKRPLMAKAAAAFADVVIATSDNPRTEDPERILDEVVAGFEPGTAYRRFLDRREAIFDAITGAQPGDTIIIAGKGHEPYQEIHGVKHPFDDLDVAREAMLAAGLLDTDAPSEETSPCTI